MINLESKVLNVEESNRTSIENFDRLLARPKKTYKSKQERIKEIQRAIDDGTKNVYEIAEIVGLKVNTVKAYVSKYKIDSPQKRSKKGPLFNRYSMATPRRDEKKDFLISQGKKLKDIARATGVTKERVRQYILGTGQYDLWRKERVKSKSEISKRKRQLEIIATQINEIAKRQVKEEDMWAYEKAEEYFRRKKWSAYDFFQIYGLFMDYKKSKDENKKVSVEKLGKNHGLHQATVSRIIKFIGEKPLCIHHKKPKRRLTKEEKLSVSRAFDTEFSNADVAYYLDIKDYIIAQYFRGYLNSGVRNTPIWIRRFGKTKDSYLKYHKASNIYQARDLGFNKLETMELLDVNEQVYDYAMQNEGDISETIIRNLRIIFSGRKIEKPYLSH